MMKKIHFWPLLCLLLNSACSHAESSYQPVSNASVPPFSISGAKRCHQHLRASKDVYIAVCQISAKDTENDYGWRIVQTAQPNDNAVPVFISGGFADAYLVNLELRKNNDSLLVLAESATEFFDGVAVFRLEQGIFNKIGNIGLAAGTAEEESQSLLPLMQIVKEDKELVVRFLGPVCYMNDMEDECTLNPDQIEYRGENKLKEIRREQKP